MNTILVRQSAIDWSRILEAVLLLRYNTRIVIIGVTILGIAAGVIGTFLLLRGRALFGDAVSHATLPGIAIAYLMMVALFGDGKSLTGLLLGALVFGLIGMASMLLIQSFTPLKDDTAIGVVLSVFFGAGVALLGIVQKTRTGHAAGLESYIYGKTASMIAQDAIIIAIAAAAILLMTIVLVKELNLMTFDPAFASAQGYPVLLLEILVIGLSVLLTVIGLQAVGLILVIALLIIPAASARFWTDRLQRMLVLAALFGALSGYIGGALSASIPNLPAGAIIVLTAGALFLFSMVFGVKKGLIAHAVGMQQFTKTLAVHRLLVTLFRMRKRPLSINELREARAVGRVTFRWVLAVARQKGLVSRSGGRVQLTARGLEAARRAARNHELQHRYLRAFPEQAQGLHQRDEERIEDFVSEEVLAILHADLRSDHPELYEGAYT